MKNSMFFIINYLFIGISLLLGISIRITNVQGCSMNPNLDNGEQLLLNVSAYNYNRFDIIVFQPKCEDEGVLYIKRIIGIPGEHVQIKNNKIFINGREIKEEYGKGKNSVTSHLSYNNTDVVLGENEYYVMGDNRENSHDSRYSDIGAVKGYLIIGKTFLK